MDREQAWQILNRYAAHVPDADPYLEGYYRLPDGDPARDEMARAAAALVREGDEQEREQAAHYLTKMTIPEDEIEGLAQFYASERLDSSSRVSRIFEQRLPASAAAVLRGVFLSDPERHAPLASLLLFRDETDTGVWDAILASVTTTSSPEVMHEMFVAAFGKRRLKEFAMAARSRPESLLRAAAEMGYERDFLDAVGLPVGSAS